MLSIDFMRGARFLRVAARQASVGDPHRKLFEVSFAPDTSRWLDLPSAASLVPLVLVIGASAQTPDHDFRGLGLCGDIGGP
jgi:hypothetical protein